MGDTANNEAKIVITTDPAQFTKFMVDAARAFRDLEKEGKGAARGIDASLGNLAGKAKQLAVDAAKMVLGPALDPAQRAMAQALDNARTWRAESTRIMGATGQDWKAIGSQIDDLSKRTGRLPKDIVSYADSVRELTGSWKTATDGAQDYSNLARYLGRESVGQMAPLAVTMENMFGVQGQGKVQGFFDAAVRGAEKLGQNGRLAVQGFERLSPMLGMQTKAGPQGERFAREAAALIPALQKQGLSPEQSEAAVGQLSSYFQGDLQGLTRQFRSAGIIGKKDRLTDEFGRLKNTLPELLGMLNKLAVGHNKGLGGDPDMLQKLLGQNFPGLLAGSVFHAPDIQKDVQTALVAGRSPSALSPIGQNAASLAATPELQRQADEIALQQFFRDTKGIPQLGVEDLGAKIGQKPKQPGGITSLAGLKQGASITQKLADERGWTYALTAGMLGGGAKGSIGERAGEYRSTVERLGGAGASPLEMSLHDPREYSKGVERGLLSQSERQDLAKANAEALGNKVLTVRIAQEMSGGTGGGRQVQ